MPFVEISALGKSYPGGFSLRDIDIVLERGQILTLMGPSGSGKTSLLRNICGLDTPDSGSIMVGGTDMTHLPVRRRNIGMIFQDLALFPHMTVYDNIAYGLRSMRVPEREARERVRDLSEMLGILDLLNRYPSRISGGQRQRVAVARSVAPSPTLLLLDEPMSSLDSQLRENVRSEIKSFAKKIGLTMIYVTHDRREGFYMGDKAGLMFNGVLSTLRSPEDIFSAPEDEKSARFLGYNVMEDGGERFAFYPTDFEFSDAEPHLEGTVMSSGFEGDIYRMHVSMPDGNSVQLWLPGNRAGSVPGQGSRVSFSITRKERISGFHNSKEY